MTRAASHSARGQVMDQEPSMKCRLAAILAADIAGYSRFMGEDEAATVRDLKEHQAVVLPLVGRYGGRIIDTAGDGILAEFPSVINATECAVEIQTVHGGPQRRGTRIAPDAVPHRHQSGRCDPRRDPDLRRRHQRRGRIAGWRPGQARGRLPWPAMHGG